MENRKIPSGLCSGVTVTLEVIELPHENEGVTEYLGLLVRLVPAGTIRCSMNFSEKDAEKEQIKSKTLLYILVDQEENIFQTLSPIEQA